MTESKQYYEKYWNRDSDVSDYDYTTPERKMRLISVLLSHSNPGDKVLDLGYGGQFTALLKKSGYDALGMDLSANAIKMAYRKYRTINYNFAEGWLYSHNLIQKGNLEKWYHSGLKLCFIN